jgi:hypothetical protein
MAGTYYGYAERNASDEINWSQIGKNLTDMLSTETKIREEKKAAIDKASREYGETLANAPQGEHQGINQWALTYADSAQQARLMQDRLLKSGQLKPKDYMVMRQNITDGTSQAFNLIKEYQAEYNDKMDRYRKGDAQALEQWLMEEAEGFANFNNSELYINPTDFTVNVAKKEKQIVDGKEVYVMSKNPNDFTTVNAMKNRIKGKFDRLDVAKTLQAGVSTLGKEKDAILKLGTLTQGGSITEILDITKRKDFGVEAKEAVSLYERAESTYLDSVMVQPTNISSILTDYVGMDPKTKESYTYTWDASKAGKNVILLKNDSAGRPVPEFTADQREVAKNALREKFRIMLDREVEIKPVAQAQLQERRAITPTEAGIQAEKDKAKNFAQNLVYSLTGDAAQSAAGTKYLTAKTGLPLTKGKESYVITNAEGKTQTFKFKPDGTLAEPRKFLKSFVGAVNTMGLNEDDVLKFVDQLLPKNSKINLQTEAQGFDVQEASQDPLTLYGNFVESSASATDIKDMGKSDAAKALNKKLSGLGVTVKPSQNPFNDNIFVVNKDGEESSAFDVKADPEGAVEGIKEWIKSNISGKTSSGKKNFVNTLISTGVIKGQAPTGNTTTPTTKPGNER